jgi:hypothetical protein
MQTILLVIVKSCLAVALWKVYRVGGVMGESTDYTRLCICCMWL